MDAKKVGKILRSLRKERDKTIAETAKDIGISHSAVTMYENGERMPRDEVKVKISNYYGVPIEAIFYAQ